MAPKRRLSKLAALVDTTPQTLTEVMGEVFHETVDELQTFKPCVCGRIARDILGHRRAGGRKARHPLHKPIRPAHEPVPHGST